jgi:hypothetical protein
MDNLSKLTLVKRHLEKLKSRSAKLSGFAGHLTSKYSLDTLMDKEQNRNASQQKMPTTAAH